jgi:hypothetical protein
MRASQVLSLFAGLVLATEVISLPFLKTEGATDEENLQFSKRSNTIHGEGMPSVTHHSHPNVAIYSQKGNEHARRARAHAKEAVGKFKSIPHEFHRKTGDDATQTLNGKSVENTGSVRTALKTAGSTVKDSGKALKHLTIAGVSHVKARSYANKELKSVPVEDVAKARKGAGGSQTLKVPVEQVANAKGGLYRPSPQ